MYTIHHFELCRCCVDKIGSFTGFHTLGLGFREKVNSEQMDTNGLLPSPDILSVSTEVKKNLWFHTREEFNIIIHMGRFCMTVKWTNPGLFKSNFGMSL